MGGERDRLAARGGAAVLLCLLASACIPGSGAGVRGAPPLAPPIAEPAPEVAPAEADDRLADIVLRTLNPTPSLAAPSIVADARDVAANSYTVQPGDTLRGIGNRTGAGSEAIAAANGLTPPYIVRGGQQLLIPAGRYHDVRAGQTGIAIARAYGVPWAAVVADNGLAEPFVLRVGRRLRLPTGSATPGDDSEATAINIDDVVTGSRPASDVREPVTRTGAAAAATPPLASSTQVSAAGFRWPLSGQVLRRFGAQPGGIVSQGIDIGAALGTPVRAARAGRIAYAGSDIAVLGGVVLIEHDGGWISAYGYLDQVAVSVGQQVPAGAIIATVGETGQATTPQLHFELRRTRVAVDPLPLLPLRR